VKASLAIVIEQEEGSAGDAHQHGGRQSSGAGSASEQQESSGLEHGGDPLIVTV